MTIKNLRRHLSQPVLLACAGLLTVIFVLMLLSESPQVSTPADYQPIPVTTVDAVPQTHALWISTTATSEARWPVQIRAQVSARVTELPTKLEPGQLVVAGEVLLGQQQVHLVAALESARSQVANAALAKRRIEHERTVALQMLSSAKVSPYARMEPQLAAANAELTAARLALESAKARLDDARLVAPFDGLITQMRVAPGQQLTEGEVVFEMIASDSIDVRLGLSEQQWLQMEQKLPQSSVRIEDRLGNHWQAKVRYQLPLRDGQSRQRQLLLTVEQPFSKNRNLMPNQQLMATLPLPAQNEVCQLPRSVLTRDGQVWSIDSAGHLHLESVVVVAEQGEQVWLKFVDNPEQPRKLIRFPLSSMLEGQRVAPRPATSEVPS